MNAETKQPSWRRLVAAVAFQLVAAAVAAGLASLLTWLNPVNSVNPIVSSPLNASTWLSPVPMAALAAFCLSGLIHLLPSRRRPNDQPSSTGSSDDQP